METTSTHDKIKALRAVNSDIVSELEFKKVMWGGYDCKEVEDYIKSLKEDMHTSEGVFNEKMDELSSSLEMSLRERDKLNKIACETQKKYDQLKQEAYETVEKIKKENEELKNLANILQEQIDNNEQNKKLMQEISQIKKENKELKVNLKSLQDEIDNDLQIITIEEMNKENKRLNDEIISLSEIKNKIVAENAMLGMELQKATNMMQKLNGENEEHKKTINLLKTAKRNNSMQTNMKIFEYKQKQQLNIDNICNNINEALDTLNDLKINIIDLAENTKLDYED